MITIKDINQSLFNADQMREIRRGLEAKLDVTKLIKKFNDEDV